MLTPAWSPRLQPRIDQATPRRTIESKLHHLEDKAPRRSCVLHSKAEMFLAGTGCTRPHRVLHQHLQRLGTRRPKQSQWWRQVVGRKLHNLRPEIQTAHSDLEVQHLRESTLRAWWAGTPMRHVVDDMRRPKTSSIPMKSSSCWFSTFAARQEKPWISQPSFQQRFQQADTQLEDVATLLALALGQMHPMPNHWQHWHRPLQTTAIGFVSLHLSLQASTLQAVEWEPWWLPLWYPASHKALVATLNLLASIVHEGRKEHLQSCM